MFYSCLRLVSPCALLAVWLCVGCEVLYAQGDVNLDEGVVSSNMVAEAFIPNSDMLTERVNDIASWYDEVEEVTYLLVGCENGTALLRLLPGARPIFMGKMPTQTVSSIWRDIKVVHDHAYVVSEAPVHGMQVLNLDALRGWSPLDGPATWMPDTVITAPGTAHNVVAFEEASKIIQVGTSLFGGGAAIFDVSNPAAPHLVGGVSEWGSIHDAQALVYNGPDAEHVGKELLFAAGGEKLWVLDITDASDVQLIGSTTYTNPHFSHQVWVSDTHDHAFLGDELDETSMGGPTRTIVFDLTDLDDPYQVEVFQAETTATDHNQYAHGEWLFQSNYRAGLRMLSDAWPQSNALSERGFFDPLAESTGPGFQGAWSHVICEEDGVVAFTSIYEGLWVVRPQFASLNNVAISLCSPGTIPSANTWSMTLNVEAGWAFPIDVQVDGVVMTPDYENHWTIDEPGSILLYFEAWGLTGVQPSVKLTSQRSTWSVNVLTPEALWVAHYEDADGDGFGNPYMPVWSCGDAPGTSTLPLDCQDWNANTYPQAPELCDGWNNDCDGEVDEGTAQLVWYIDADGDGYGNPNVPFELSCTALTGRVLNADDCNDAEATMYPSAPSILDGMDNNCDGVIAESELNPCPGDFDLDGNRTINDMLQILSSFGCASGCSASMDNLDTVDTSDLLLWLGVFGVDCD